MNTEIFSGEGYQKEAQKTKDKETELARLLQAKSEKLANNFLVEKCHTQLSYLSPNERTGAVSLPKGVLLDKLLSYLRSI